MEIMIWGLFQYGIVSEANMDLHTLRRTRQCTIRQTILEWLWLARIVTFRYGNIQYLTVVSMGQSVKLEIWDLFINMHTCCQKRIYELYLN
jgi:hypothetical protein